MRRVYTATVVAVCEVAMLSRFAYTHALSVLAADNVFALSCVLGIACAVVEAAGAQLAAPRAEEAWVHLLHLRVALAAYAYTPPWILGLYVGAAWVYLCASAGFRNAGCVRAIALGTCASMWTAWAVLVFLHRAGRVLLVVVFMRGLRYNDTNAWMCHRFEGLALLWGLALVHAPPGA